MVVPLYLVELKIYKTSLVSCQCFREVPSFCPFNTEESCTYVLRAMYLTFRFSFALFGRDPFVYGLAVPLAGFCSFGGLRWLLDPLAFACAVP